MAATSPTNDSMGPRFVISKPTTVNDVGSPSDNLVSDVHRIVALIQDERHMIAEELLASVQQRMTDYEKEIATAASKSSSSSSSKFKLRRSASSKTRQDRSKEMDEVKQLVKKHGAMLVKLQVNRKKKKSHREDYRVTLAPRL
jgi:hypothetical protein